LLVEYKTDAHKLPDNKLLPYVMAKPTTFGVLLYTTAMNRLDEWRSFPTTDFGNFPDVALPAYFTSSLDELIKKTHPENDASQKRDD
jgi:hypothetical protein